MSWAWADGGYAGEARHLGCGQFKPKLTVKIAKGPMTCTPSRSCLAGRWSSAPSRTLPGTGSPAGVIPAAAGRAGGLRPAVILGFLAEVRVFERLVMRDAAGGLVMTAAGWGADDGPVAYPVQGCC